MLLENQSYLDEEILDKLNIDYKKIDGLYNLTSNNIYYLDEYLVKYHNNTIQYKFGLKATKDFQLQIKNFQDRYFTFLALNLNEILVIDGDKFLLIPNEIYKIEILNNNIDLYNLKHILYDHYYIPPEIRNVTNNILPITPIYFSIGHILIKIIFNNNIIQNLQNIKYTPLYYCIYRCILENPKHRYFVLV